MNIQSLHQEPVNDVPKRQFKRIKPTQRQLGEISNKVRKQVAERSSGVCELCHTLRAVQMAHIVGRKQLTELTTAKLLLHVCIPCHDWLDKTIEGIRFKRDLSATANAK